MVKQPKKFTATQERMFTGMIARIDAAQSDFDVAQARHEGAEKLLQAAQGTAMEFLNFCAEEAGLKPGDCAPTPTPGKWTFDQGARAFVYTPEDDSGKDGAK